MAIAQAENWFLCVKKISIGPVLPPLPKAPSVDLPSSPPRNDSPPEVPLIGRRHSQQSGQSVQSASESVDLATMKKKKDSLKEDDEKLLLEKKE